MSLFTPLSRGREPPAPFGWRLAVMEAVGEHEQARALLEALNRVERAFGGTEYEMPTPAGPTEGGYWCRADVPYDRQRLDECPENHRPRWAA